MERPLDRVLSLLDGVIESKGRPGEYRAYSPFQEAKGSRTLALKEGDDGRALIHDLSGRDAQEIVSALGLEFWDLFPKADHRTDRKQRPWRPTISRGDAWDICGVERRVIHLYGSDLRAGKKPSDKDHARFLKAMKRMDDLARCVR